MNSLPQIARGQSYTRSQFPLSLRTISRLDHLIAVNHLHDSADPFEPVDVAWISDQWTVYRRNLPNWLNGMALQWRNEYHRFEVIVWNNRLTPLSKSAERRWTLAHELGHLVCEHPGNSLADGDCRRHEREADYVAAYLLVPKRALLAMRGMTSTYVARLLDIPEHLAICRLDLVGS